MTKLAATVRRAAPSDVEAMHRIRLSVNENRLADTTKINEDSYRSYVAAETIWVAEVDGAIVGFAAVDLESRSVWALFVDPSVEGAGVGKTLHNRILRWSQDEGVERLTLSTSAGSRAEQFYRGLGWSDISRTAEGEIQFEMIV